VDEFAQEGRPQRITTAEEVAVAVLLASESGAGIVDVLLAEPNEFLVGVAACPAREDVLRLSR
jgi:hypothetical protein